jgi:outer membrane receptor protein involved in Fe transport
VMIYASYSQGYKTGGWTTRLSAGIHARTSPREGRQLRVGLKSEMLDHHRAANLAASTLYKKFSLRRPAASRRPREMRATPGSRRRGECRRSGGCLLAKRQRRLRS